MIKKYGQEDFGQYDFYENYLKLIDKDLSIEEVLEDNSDGILRGNILEFKK